MKRSNNSLQRIFSKKPSVSRRAVLALVAGGAGAVAAVAWRMSPASSTATPAGSPGIKVALYKDPQCSCCEGYADYLRGNGFSVSVSPTHDLLALYQKYGIPIELEPCHLSLIDGYVVGGHVPVEVVHRLLTERPKITGVTLPGMPEGSPGMGGTKHAPFQIYEIAAGPPRIYATI